jgi:hypothetical protein
VRPSLRLLRSLLVLLAVASPAACQRPRESGPDPATIAIDLEHILRGGINRQGELVGLHHQPSAPASMDYQGKSCELWFVYTSPGADGDIRTARAELRDPKSQRVLLEKFSTLFPKAWSEQQVEAAIREAFADALKRKTVDTDGRWQGKTRGGIRIDGFMTRDGQRIATAFPVYIRPRDDRRR